MSETKNDSAFKLNFQGDIALWVCTILLIGVGMLVVYSSASARSVTLGISTERIFLSHLSTMALGIISMLITSKINYRWFGALSILMMFISLVLMILVSFTSAAVTINDASRWLRVPVIGLTFQPSDFAKLSVMIYLSYTLAKLQNSVEDFKKILIQSVGFPLVIILLIAKNNISTSILLFLLLITMMFVARVSKKIFMWMGVIALAMLPLVYFTSHRMKTAVSRLSDYFSSDTSAVAYSDLPYQVEQSNIAIALGGFNGVGAGHSQQRYFLPEAFSDYIYAIIIEEHGMKAGIFILVVFIAIFYRTMKITQKTSNPFAGLLVTGLGLLVVFQALIHMAVVTGVSPVTGLTLPWISTGGTSIIFTGIAFGIIQNVSREVQANEQ